MRSLKSVLLLGLFLLGLLSGLSTTGCSTTSMAQEFKDSLGLFYPVKKLGDGVSRLGDGLAIAATPRKWTQPEEKPFPETASEDQRCELEAFAVQYDRNREFEVRLGFGAGAFQYQEPIRSIFLRVEAWAGFRFDWYLSPNLPDLGMAAPGGVITVNPNLMARVSPQAMYLVLLHECGHHVLGHTSGCGTVVGMIQPFAQPSFELAADRYAALRLLAAGFAPQQIVYAALELYDNKPATPTHPSGRQRVQNIEAALRSAMGQ